MSEKQVFHMKNRRSNQDSALIAASCFIVGCLAGDGLIEVDRDRENTAQGLYEAIWIVADCLSGLDVVIGDAWNVPIVQPPTSAE
jgi:hypothetical protein